MARNSVSLPTSADGWLPPWPHPLISTKLGPPHYAGPLVPRDRLYPLLELGLQRRLTLLRAAAGFGKTTLLAQWRQVLLERGIPVAWLSLDEEDDEPSQFLAYVAATLGEAARGALGAPRLFQEPGTPVPVKAVIASLINDLATLGRQIVLILDDYQRLANPAIHEAVSRLLLHAPANLQLIIASRGEPPLPLSRLRAEDQLVVLDAAELRFVPAEGEHFLRHHAPCSLTPAQVQQVHAATEGWVAGLQLFAISLRGQADASGFSRAFSGRSRAISAYLEQTVFTRLSQPTVEFLMRTALLERLCAPLCETVTGVSDGQAMLESLEAQQLFLQPLDEEGRWFRYHRLFAEFLQFRLQREHPTEIPLLHQRACDWFSAQGLWAEAVRHALAAGNESRAIELVQRCARRLVEGGGIPLLLGWLNRLPPEALHGEPRLRLDLAWALTLSYRLDEARRLLDELAADAALAAELRADLHAAQALHAAFSDDSAQALAQGYACLASQPPAGAWARGVTGNVLRYACVHAGRFAELGSLPSPGPAQEGTRSDAFQAVYCQVLLGQGEWKQGRLGEAAKHYRGAFRLAAEALGAHSTAAALAACFVADLCYEWNETERVRPLLEQRFEVIDEACPVDAVLRAYRALARTLALAGEPGDAHSLLSRAQQLGQSRRWPRLEAVCLAERLRLSVERDEIAEAERLLFRLQSVQLRPAAERCAASEIQQHYELGKARLLLAKGEYTLAVRLIESQLEQLHGSGFRYQALRHRILLARALDSAGLRDKALRCLERALSASAPAGLVRSFVDEGGRIRLLLEELQSFLRRRPHSLIPLTYLDHLLAAFARTAPAAAPAAGALLEALSLREHDILSLIARGLSNKEIARVLDISLETVKWHLKNLYGKLGVASRTQAVHRARSLGLLG
ncbi:MAG TPA: LuxR C-terminal-related transcriptional regulator [Candidatus Competibacteraceae bacterium]|nr:LuxR C-terminal-related transcriptional regulator [Candidatus Competibacteraceae bacterium]